MGTFAKDDYATASRAALVGGTTTLIEMCCPGPQRRPAGEAFELWRSKAKGARGRATTRSTWASSRFDDTTARASSARSSARGRRVVQGLPRLQGRASASTTRAVPHAHAAGEGAGRDRHRPLRERRRWSTSCSSRCSRKGRPGPSGTSRRARRAVEAEGVHHLMHVRRDDRAPTSTASTPRAARRSRRCWRRATARRATSWVETVIPYLVLDKTYAERPTSKAPSTSCRRRCATSATSRRSGTRCARGSSAPSPPTTPRSTSMARKRWAATTSQDPQRHSVASKIA